MASKIVIILILVLDIIAFGFALGAQLRSHKALVQTGTDGNKIWCSYNPDKIASNFGLVASFCLAASHITVMVATLCYFRRQALSPGKSRGPAIIMCIICWYSFLITWMCLTVGSGGIAFHIKNKQNLGDPKPICEALRKGVFAAGAVFTLFTAIISEVYYIRYSKTADSLVVIP